MRTKLLRWKTKSREEPMSARVPADSPVWDLSAAKSCPKENFSPRQVALTTKEASTRICTSHRTAMAYCGLRRVWRTPAVLGWRWFITAGRNRQKWAQTA